MGSVKICFFLWFRGLLEVVRLGRFRENWCFFLGVALEEGVFVGLAV